MSRLQGQAEKVRKPEGMRKKGKGVLPPRKGKDPKIVVRDDKKRYADIKTVMEKELWV